MAPPSIPLLVTIASPRTAPPANEIAMRLSGAPLKRFEKTSDQATRNPQFAGASGVISTPDRRNTSTQLASDPSRGQLAPPSASTVAVGRIVTRPCGVAKTRDRK